MLVAKYTANASGLVPTFNSGYKYDVNETVNNGVYTVEINSNSRFYHCKFQDKTSLLTVEYLNITNSVTDMANMFRGCSNLTAVNTSNWDTSNVTGMQYMFLHCSKLTHLDVSNWKTDKVIYMSYMFDSCANLTQLDVSNWKTSSVTKTEAMFYGCTSLTQLDVSKWDTSQVINMTSMFYECNKLTQLDLSNWDTSKVTNMSYMFNGCRVIASLDVSNWDTSNVTNMNYLFCHCPNLTSLDLSNFDTKNVTNMSNMFAGCKTLTSLDVSNFDTSNVKDMSNMFQNCNTLTSLDVSNFDTSNVTNMTYMFYGCKTLTSLDLSNFNTTKVENMDSMFFDCNALISLDVSNFDTTRVTNMNSMFYNCDKLDNIGLIYSDIDTINTLPIPSKATLYIDKNIDQSAYTGSSTLKVYEERSIEINIPTALRSKNGIADRLYWNDEDKHYYIEQWIDPNTEEVLEEPNIIASGIVKPIELKQYQEQFSINIQNQTPSYISTTVPYFDIPNDYEYDEAKEIEYFKESFELRFPDEDDVGSDYGFAHVNGDYSMGLKRLIDWVDFSTDEEFVRDFEQYFHKQYTFRYYLLVIVLGMVDNLG